jgi:serine/threonine protein kinase
VYYGTWHGQAVAIKVLNPQSADSAKLMSEFNREVSTMTRLPEHPHVLKLLGVCTTPPNLALVTQ